MNRSNINFSNSSTTQFSQQSIKKTQEIHKNMTTGETQ